MSETAECCGHPIAMHGPEVPGCVECRCRATTPADRAPGTAEGGGDRG